MSHQKMTAGKLAAAAEELFRVRGYHNTSIADIAQYCNLSKASLYHHISSKKQLAMLTIKNVHSYLQENVFSLAYNEELPEAERLQAFCDALREYYINREGGCLVGNLALEIGENDEEFRALFKQVFADWIDAFTAIYKLDQEAETAAAKARESVATIQGAIMLCNTFQNSDALVHFLDQQTAKVAA